MNGKEIAGSVSQPEVRYEMLNFIGKVKSAKLAPVMAHALLGRESGMLQQEIGFELAPVAGRLTSQIFAKVTVVGVPIQAVDALLNDGDETAGITEIIRRRIMEKEVIFPLEEEGELTKRMGINPRSVSGVKKVSSVARIAHNAAVNHLRKRRYIYADLLDADNADMTPAIIDQTVLNRFGGALDPDEHINGSVSLDLSESQAPVRGIKQVSNSTGGVTDAANVALNTTANSINLHYHSTGYPMQQILEFARKSGNPSGTDLDIYADLEEIAAGGFSLTDLYNAQKADNLIRRMRDIADANPEAGEDAVLRWVFGLSADSARFPFVMYENRFPMSPVQRSAMDQSGMLDETLLTYPQQRVAYSVPIPSTELGMIVITFVQVTPDEVVAAQPHPIFSDSWTAANHAAETMRLDPEQVTYRDLFSDIETAADETDPIFYVGANALKRTYLQHGFNRQVDPDTVEAKTVLWNYAIPAGVTPENILYPDDFEQYPFLDQLAEIVTYEVDSRLAAKTNIFFGPTPVEKLAVVDDQSLLEE